MDFKSNLIVLADFSLLQTVCFSEGSYLIKLKPDGNPDLNFAENGVLNLQSNNYINPKGNYLLKVYLKNGSSVCKKIMKL